MVGIILKRTHIAPTAARAATSPKIKRSDGMSEVMKPCEELEVAAGVFSVAVNQEQGVFLRIPGLEPVKKLNARRG